VRRTNVSGYAYGVASGMLWGLDAVVLGLALSLAAFSGGGSAWLAPLVVAGLHDGVSALWMLGFDAVTGRVRLVFPTIATRRGLVLCGAALLGGPFAMSAYLLGISLAGPGYTAAVSATYPAVGAVLAGIFLRERITRRVWMGICLTIAGAITVTYTPGEGAQNFYLGIAFALCATFGWGAEGVLAIHSMKVIDSNVAGTVRMLTSSTVYLLIVFPLIGAYGLAAQALGGSGLLVLLLAGGTGAGSYLLYYAANHLIGASRAMPLNAMYALWALIFGFAVTGLSVTRSLALGTIVTLTGAVLIVSSGSSRPDEVEDESGAAAVGELAESPGRAG
jgi:drug/metabolite transporter (DMT)-like permease